MRDVIDIVIERSGLEAEGPVTRFHVRVIEDGSATEHEVTLSTTDHLRLAGDRTPEDFVRACFQFLLEREPKESILRSFDLCVIGRYFPEFERTISA
jgi:hypothetical protein